MILTKYFAFVLIWLLVLSLDNTEATSGDALPSPTSCVNCNLCQYPCNHHQPPPPAVSGGYPSYGAPPPPFSGGYPSYGAPPPPQPPSSQGGANCIPPPAQGNSGIQCCENPPPSPYTYLPYENYNCASRLSSYYYLVLNLILVFSSSSAVVF